MQVGPVVQDRGAGRDADRAAEVAHQVEQARGELQALGRERAEPERDRRRDRELLREAAQRLGQQQLAPAPVVGDRREEPHAEGEAGKAEHHQPAQIDPPREEGVDRDRRQLEQAGREHRHADLQGAEVPHPAEEQGRQIDRGEDADAGDEREEAAEREVPDLERPEVDHRIVVGQAAPEERDPGEALRSRRSRGWCGRRTSPSAGPPRGCIRGSPGTAPSAPCRDSRRGAAATGPAGRSGPGSAPRWRRRCRARG